MDKVTPLCIWGGISTIPQNMNLIENKYVNEFYEDIL